MPVRADKLKRMFDSDSKIMLETLHTLVNEILAGSADVAVVDRAFRAAHSIKSEAGFLQLTDVSNTAHALEATLAGVRAALQSDKGAGPPAALTEQLGQLQRQIEQYRTDAGAGANQSPVREGSSPQEESIGPVELDMLREARARNERLYRVDVRLTCPPALCYPRAFLVINNLELNCGVIQCTPALESLRIQPQDEISILLTSVEDASV